MFTFFFLAAFLGQSLFIHPTFATQQCVSAATPHVAPAEGRPVATARNTHWVTPKAHKPAKRNADSSVHAITLTKCDMMGDYNIPAQRYDETMQQITHATSCGIFDGHMNQSESNFLSAVVVSPVRGHMSVRDAMLMALKGSRFEVVREEEDTLYVRLREQK